MQEAELLHKIAKGLAAVEGISEDKAIKIIRGEYTPNSELHLKIPQLQTSVNPLDSTVDLFAKGSAEFVASESQSQVSALEMRKIELEERRLETEQRRYDAEQRREDAAAQERKDNLIMQQDRLSFEREQARMSQELRRDEMKLERETTRADQKFTQLLALGQGKGSDEILKMIENQSSSQREYFKEINTVKDNEREHTDRLRTDLAKIESDRDVELATLKAGSDQSTADEIDALIKKMDENFHGLMKPNDDGEDFIDKYNKQIEKVNKFQENLTAAGLKTLQSQGVDVDALKKAHNIATDSEESTLDKIIGVGKHLYEKTIKPGMEEAAKNGSGSGINAPSGLETAFEAPDTEMEDRIRAEQESDEQNNQLALQENAALKIELEQYENDLYNKALQYGIPTHGLSIEELGSMINQYETIMNTPFNSAPQTKSIVGMRQMALELKINTNGKTVVQVEAEVIQAQQKIEQQLDELPDYIPVQESGPELGETQESLPTEEQEPDLTPIPPDETQDSLPIEEQEPDLTQVPPDETQNSLPIEEPDPEETHKPIIKPDPEISNPEKTIDHKTDIKKPLNRKRSVTAQHTSDIENNRLLKTFITQDGTEVKGKTPHSAAMKMAKELGGTADFPIQVELTDENGKIHVFDTRMDESKLRGGITKVPRAKKVST